MGSMVSPACSSPRRDCALRFSSARRGLFQYAFSTRQALIRSISRIPIDAAAATMRLSTLGRGNARTSRSGSAGGGSRSSRMPISSWLSSISSIRPRPIRPPTTPTRSSFPAAARCTRRTCSSLRPCRRTRSGLTKSVCSSSTRFISREYPGDTWSNDRSSPTAAQQEPGERAEYNRRSGELFVYRTVALVALLLGALTLVLAGRQSKAAEAQQQARLKILFPTAISFSAKEGQPPHFTAYADSSQTVLGYAFWTTELVPLERGYGGPIAMLVGIDLKGVLTGLVVGEHHEPYGNFSIDPPGFAAQFKNKDVRDPFKLGSDIDAVSRATITMASAVRAVRNSSRAMARTLLTPPGAKP